MIMKTVGVNVRVQMDIKSTGDDVCEVLNVLEQVNDFMRMQFPDQQPQFMTAGIDQDDIITYDI